MAKYRMLLVGNNTDTIDDIFLQMRDTFECMTTSLRHDDMIGHFRYFEPDVFLYCMENESADGISRFIAAKQQLITKKTQIGIYASSESLAEFATKPGGSVDFELLSPMTVMDIKDGIVKKLESEGITPAEKSSAASASASTASVLSSAAGGAGGDSSKKHVLVIDDDPMMLKLIKEYLHEDYQVATAINGRTAFKYLETRSADLILLDFEMPGDSGPEVLEKLRARHHTASIPVIFLTGITEREKIARALAQKPQGYLLKPIDHEKLMATIAKFI